MTNNLQSSDEYSQATSAYYTRGKRSGQVFLSLLCQGQVNVIGHSLLLFLREPDEGGQQAENHDHGAADIGQGYIEVEHKAGPHRPGNSPQAHE